MMMIITYALRNQAVNMNDAVEYVWHMTRENFSMYHTSNTRRSIFPIWSFVLIVHTRKSADRTLLTVETASPRMKP